MHRLLALLFVLVLAGPAATAETRGDARVHLGLRYLDEDAWGSLSNQIQWGVQVAVAKPGWPVEIAVQLSQSKAIESELVPGAALLLPFSILSPDAFQTVAESKTTELGVGVRKSWRSSGVRPYLAVGPMLVRGRLQLETLSGSGRSFGYWTQAGLLFGSETGVSLGLDWRYSRATIRLAGVEAEAGGPQYALTLGWGW